MTSTALMLPAIETMFRSLQEQIDTKEKVVELNRVGKRQPRIRYLVLSLQLGEGTDGGDGPSEAMLHVVGESSSGSSSKKLPCEIKRSVSTADLQRTELDGASGATMFFHSGAPPLSIAFESTIQRDVFLARMKQLNRTRAAEGSTASPGLDMLFIATAAMPEKKYPTEGTRAAAGADRRVLAPEEEAMILHAMNEHSSTLSDMKSFEETLRGRISSLEMDAADKLIRDAAMWQDVQRDIASTVRTIVKLERHIDHYSTELVARKDVIKSIEHRINAQCRMRDNIHTVVGKLSDLENQLTLSPQTEQVIFALSHVGDNLVEFMLNDVQLKHIVAAIQRIEEVDKSTKLDEEFPLAVVEEQRCTFRHFRAMMANQVKSYAFVMTDIFKAEYAKDKSRYSRKNAIVWLPHTELCSKLMQIGPVVATLVQCDPRGHLAMIRHYCALMQPIHSKEIRCFFREIRNQVRKVGYRGGLLLGVRDAPERLLNFLTEDGELSNPAMPSAARSPAFMSPTPERYNAGPSDAGSNPEEELQVRLPNLSLAARLLWPGGANYDVLLGSTASRASAASHTSFLSRVAGEATTGVIRPDLAMAVVLEAVCDIVLYEENFLKEAMRCSNDGVAPLPLLHALNELFAGDSLVLLDAPQQLLHIAVTRTSEQPPTKVISLSLLQTEFIAFSSFVVNHCDRSYVVPVLSMLDALLAHRSVVQSVFLPQLLTDCRDVFSSGLMRFLAEQSESISRCAKRGSYDGGLLPCLAKLPVLFHRLESCNAILKNPNPSRYEKVVQELTRNVFAAVEEVAGSLFADSSTVLDSYAVHFIHNAFFVVAAHGCAPETQRIISSHVHDAESKRDDYESAFLTRAVFASAFRQFAPFAISAEELVRTYPISDLRHHKALSLENVRDALSALENELESGMKAGARSIKTALTRGVKVGSTVEAFVKALLLTTWRHYVDLVSHKLSFTENLLHLLEYSAVVVMPSTVGKLRDIVAELEQADAAA